MATNPPDGSVHQLNPRFSPPFASPIAGRFGGRRTIAAAATVLLSVTGVTSAVAATQVTEQNLATNKLVSVGPVNAENGFPSWYEDRSGTRVELCLDAENPLCGFLPGDIPNDTAPISFPDNFPEEAFYMLASSGLDLPGGGKATLVLGLEAAFANTVTDGDQMVFGRQRIVVKGGPANATLTFQHPYGTITVDTDGTGAGRLVEDISPAVGNFTTALKSNIGPFLKWDPATAPAAPAGYLGDPNQDHTVTGGLRNTFSVSGGGLNLSTNQFTLQGKIATNSGVSADSAVVNGNMIDIFASSKPAAQLQVEAQAGKFALTPMATDADSGRFYARIPFTGTAPTSVKITNIADKPASSGTITVTKPSSITVTSATFDGAKLNVAALSSSGDPLEVVGVGPLVNPAAGGAPAQGSWTLNAPPAKVTVKNAAGDTASLAVSVSGGTATQAGLPPLSPTPDPGPVVDTGTGTTPPGGGTTTPPGGGTTPPTTLKAAATPASATVARGASVQLDGSTSTGGVSYKWSQVDGPAVTLAGDTTAKPTVAVPFYAKTTDTAPLPAAVAGPAHIKLVVTALDGSTSETTVALTIQTDAVAIDAGSRHRIGTELRITGTSALAGSTGVLTPATSVVIYDMTSGTAVKIGTAQVDTLGAWSYKAKPGPTRQITRVMVQSTRGGTATSAIATR